MRWVVGCVGTALVLVGAVLALRPFRSLTVLVLLLVVALALSGVGDLVRGRRPWGPLRGMGQLGLALGLLLWPGPGLGVLTLFVAASLVVDGVLDLAEAVRARGPSAARWTDGLFGAAQLLVGLVALLWRDVALLAVAVAFGVRMVVLGVRLLAAAVAATALAATGVVVQLDHPRPDAFYAPPEEVPPEPGRLLAAEPFTRQVPDGASAWRILYTTTREDGIPAVASGLVVTPDDAAGPTPVVAWAHGTTGWAPGCAPSVLDEPWESGALFVLDDVLDRGWTVVATDYVGLGTASPHPYLIGQGEGRSVLDSVRAARALAGPELDGRTVVWGHSQGGHAALWTGILAPDYAPELEVDGVAALAPAADVAALVRVVEGSRLLTFFASYVAQAYSEVYDDVELDDYVRPGAQLVVREMAHRCLSERGIAVSVGQSLLLDRPVWHRDPTTGPLGERLEQNVPTGRVEAPLLVAQGAADTLVTAQAQRAWVEDRCAAGQRLDYRTYEGRDHLGLVAADSPAVADLLAWTEARLAGEPAADTC